MRATVVQLDAANYELEVGQGIEVLGFVAPINGRGGYTLEAVWRDEQGYIWTIPTSAIRMEPRAYQPRIVESEPETVPS